MKETMNWIFMYFYLKTCCTISQKFHNLNVGNTSSKTIAFKIWHQKLSLFSLSPLFSHFHTESLLVHNGGSEKRVHLSIWIQNASVIYSSLILSCERTLLRNTYVKFLIVSWSMRGLIRQRAPNLPYFLIRSESIAKLTRDFCFVSSKNACYQIQRQTSS